MSQDHIVNRLKIKSRNQWWFSLCILLILAATFVTVSQAEEPPVAEETTVVSQSLSAITADGTDSNSNHVTSSLHSGKVLRSTQDDIAFREANGLDESQAEETRPPWRVYFWASPGADGTSLFISTGRTAELNTPVNGQVIGPTGKGAFGMSYADDNSTYEALIGGVFIAGSSIAEGQIGLTSDLGSGQALDTGLIDFRRFLVRTTSAARTTGASLVVSNDNLLEMTISPNSLDADSYIVVLPANDLPGDLPLGHQLVGNPYSVVPSGADFISNNPLLLKMFYTNATLGDLESHTLTILQWDSVTNTWSDLGGTLDDLIENSLSTTTERFTAYALVSAPRWVDQFSDFTGLSVHENTTVLFPNGDLVLNGLSPTGTAISRPITPTTAIDEWGTLSFVRSVPDGTSLTIDVLDGNDNVLLSDVISGTSLASVDPALYPALKLRANFATDDLSQTPTLSEWRLDWQPEIAKANLELTKSDSPDPVMAGEALTYTFNITNHGPHDATGVTLTNTLPSDVTYNAAANGCKEADGVASCFFGDLAVNEVITKTLTVMTSAQAGMLTNKATIVANEFDPDLADNSATITTTVILDQWLTWLPMIMKP